MQCLQIFAEKKFKIDREHDVEQIANFVIDKLICFCIIRFAGRAIMSTKFGKSIGLH